MAIGSLLMLLFPFLIILIHFANITTAQVPDFRYSYCTPGGNYTRNSTYQTNLNTVLSHLPSNTSTNYGFYNTSAGQGLDTVNTIALCRGDISRDSCLDCISDATSKLREVCPNQKEALGGYDECMLRYSNASIFRRVDQGITFFLYNENNVTSIREFNDALRNLTDKLQADAAAGGSLRKFATGNVTGPDPLRIFGLMQCTPDLSESQCRTCLYDAAAQIPTCCSGRQGGRVVGASCNLRYEISSFYGEFHASSLPSHSPPPPGIVYVVDEVPAMLYNNCTARANYTTNSTYRTNLDIVLSYLPSNTSNNHGFYNTSAGQDPDTVNTIALCRGDISPDSCRDCISDAIRKLREVCPNQKEAFGGYDNCMLRYSDASIFHTEGQGPTFVVPNPDKVPNFDEFYAALRNLLDRLQTEAADSRSLQKFSTGTITVTGPGSLTIYGLMQCTPDLSEEQCSNCLAGTREPFPESLNERDGGKVFRPSCNIRYDINSFYAENPATSIPSQPPPPPPSGNNNIALIVASIVAAVAVICILIFFICLRLRRKKKQQGEDLLPESEAASSNLSADGSKHHIDKDDTDEMSYFNLATIQAATNNFSADNKLGEGGFGPVYKGLLPDGNEIAVKRLSRNSGQGLEEFKTEVRLIVKLQHKNLVRLLGCCIKGHEKLLVYEYMANTSLDAFLFDPIKCKELDWPMRANIVSGIAKGLRYLHEDSRLKIVHRDMKASNVLLDADMNAKISDFGTARIFGGKQIEAVTNRVVGTYGYMAPEYAMEGLFSAKSDAYSFGVLLLEIISGKKNSGFHHQDQIQNLLSYAWQLWKDNKGEQFIDEKLINNCPVHEAVRWINIALLCVQEEPTARPTMSSVVFMLEGEWTTLPQPLEPPFSVGRFTFSDLSSTIGAGTLSLKTDDSSTSASA